jgi:hypothetical protein
MYRKITIYNYEYCTLLSTHYSIDKLFHETNSDLLPTCMDLPTVRYTESEIIEVMNYLLYVFISSVCMHTCM